MAIMASTRQHCTLFMLNTLIKERDNRVIRIIQATVHHIGYRKSRRDAGVRCCRSNSAAHSPAVYVPERRRQRRSGHHCTPTPCTGGRCGMPGVWHPVVALEVASASPLNSVDRHCVASFPAWCRALIRASAMFYYQCSRPQPQFAVNAATDRFAVIFSLHHPRHSARDARRPHEIGCPDSPATDRYATWTRARRAAVSGLLRRLYFRRRIDI